jgi:hypothetical protein
MVDVVETSFYVCFEDVSFLSHDCVDLFDGVMASPSWSESIAVWLEYCLPFWLHDHFCYCLPRSVCHGWYPQRASLSFAWFGYPYPAYWGSIAFE